MYKRESFKKIWKAIAKRKSKDFLLLTGLGFLFFFAQSALAASPTFYFRAPESLAPGSVFNMDVLLDTDAPINALDITVQFSADTFEVVGFDNSRSIVNIWQDKPEASGDTIRFSGGMTEQFIGAGGHVLGIQFKAKSEGEGRVTFADSRVYLADGQGTEVTPSSRSAQVTLLETARVETVPEVFFEDTPEDIEIAEELASFRENRFWTHNLPLILLIILIVIAGAVLYNKWRKKP